MRKMISALLVCSMLCVSSFAGCEHDESKTDISVSSTASEGSDVGSIDQTAAQDYQTVSPPVDGWTEESIAETIRFCGKSIDLPFKVGNLGEGFEFVDDTGCVTYNGHDVFVAAFVNNDRGDDPYNATVRKLGSFEHASDEDFENCFQINGIGICSDKEAVRNALGDPDFEDERAYEYYVGHDPEQTYLVRLHFGKSDVVQSMFVNLISE